MSDGSCCHYCKRYKCICEGSPETHSWDKKEETGKRVPLNPFYQWIGEQQQWLQSNRELLHPAVFHMAMRMLPGLAELHATDKPVLSLMEEEERGDFGELGLSLVWNLDPSSPLYEMQINLFPPDKPAGEYEQYNPWRPVHPPGVWNSF